MLNFLGYLEWYDYMRITTSLLFLMAMYRSGKRAWRCWGDYTDRLRQLWWILNALMLVTAEGSIEAIFQHIPFGSRVLLYFIVALAAVRGTWHGGTYLKSEERP